MSGELTTEMDLTFDLEVDSNPYQSVGYAFISAALVIVMIKYTYNIVDDIFFREKREQIVWKLRSRKEFISLLEDFHILGKRPKAFLEYYTIFGLTQILIAIASALFFLSLDIMFIGLTNPVSQDVNLSQRQLVLTTKNTIFGPVPPGPGWSTELYAIAILRRNETLIGSTFVSNGSCEESLRGGFQLITGWPVLFSDADTTSYDAKYVFYVESNLDAFSNQEFQNQNSCAFVQEGIPPVLFVLRRTTICTTVLSPVDDNQVASFTNVTLNCKDNQQITRIYIHFRVGIQFHNQTSISDGYRILDYSATDLIQDVQDNLMNQLKLEIVDRSPFNAAGIQTSTVRQTTQSISNPYKDITAIARGIHRDIARRAHFSLADKSRNQCDGDSCLAYFDTTCQANGLDYCIDFALGQEAVPLMTIWVQVGVAAGIFIVYILVAIIARDHSEANTFLEAQAWRDHQDQILQSIRSRKGAMAPDKNDQADVKIDSPNN